jgi:hypothetical protein
MIDLDKFIMHQKCLLLAPAGFGKTHTIADCLLRLPLGSKKQLILTHTHAGVTSIKEKLKKLNVPNNYEIETISSFIQRYVLSYNHNKTIPSIENSKNYYTFINDSALRLFKSIIINDVIKSTYSGLFVDEYQDCTKKQHEIIKILAELIPTRILGDFLQGIFEFNEPTVDLTSTSEMDGFIQNSFELTQPQRWLNGNNITLGNELKSIREKLIDKKEIDLKLYNSIELYNYPSLDLHTPQTKYNQLIWKLINNSPSLLVIHSNNTSVEPRKKINQKFNNSLTLIESIDDKLFYKVSKLIDEINDSNSEIKLRDISLLLFNKTEVNSWFNEKGFKRKIKLEEKRIIEELKHHLLDFKTNIKEVLITISKLPKFKCYRPEILYSLLKSIEIANNENIDCYNSMINHRNTIRRFGRKIEGKCIGTTLLTKGLEFDTVLILDAHKFNSSKHFYVALTRACNKLVVVTEKNTLILN